jgi:histidinol phosphatase-like enzyme
LADDAPNRKPQCGMAYQAQQQFPDIDLSKSIMVGNRLSDMGFARNAGMHSVFLATTHPEIEFPHPSIDFRFNSLIEFANAL